MPNLHQSYLILVMYTFVIYTQQQKDPAFAQAHTKNQIECAKEMGLEVEYVKNVWKENHFPNDSKLKCYFKCMTLKMGMINAAGDTVDDMLKKVELEFSDEATGREVVEECGAIQGTDLCDTAYRLLACVKAAELD